MTDDVRAFLDGSETNYGWMLQEIGNPPSAGPYFRSSDTEVSGDDPQGTIADRPKLTLTFVPEPASLALLGVGGGLLLAGRRRRHG